MEPWSNIEITSDDPEILKIGKIQELLGDIPQKTLQIRELISGFEVCHFKYLQHINYIKSSITKLKPNIELQRIGAHHIRQAEVEWMKDKSGRSRVGQQYISALTGWLKEDPGVEQKNESHEKSEEMIWGWLGERDMEKIRLVKLLVARLKWDWASYEKLLKGADQDELEFQVCRMDICHYTFPDNMDRIIQAIGRKQPVENFEGCGSYNQEIKNQIEKEFKLINDQLESFDPGNEKNLDQFARLWLISCLAKTIKEQTGLKKTIHFPNI